jgi:nucleotide-binding universal stress UspA family protein
MTKPIVVGVDPFHDDPGPISLAGLLARTLGARVVAVAAYPNDGYITRATSAAFEHELARKAEDALSRVPATLDGVEVATRAVGEDSPARALHDAAEDEDAAIVVVGSKHGGPVGRLLPGGVTDQVINGAGRPVAVAPHGYAPAEQSIGRIAVAFIDTPEGREALRGGIALGRRSGAAVRALTTIEPVLLTPAMGWPGPVDTTHAQLEEEHAAQSRAVATVAGDAVVETEIHDGRTSTLADASGGYDLMICGSRGYGPLKTVLLGSVSHRLARSARCPLIVLPRGSADAFEQLLAGAETKAIS